MVGNFGGGILFLLLLLICAVAALGWVVVWLIYGFRSQGWGNPNGPRRLAVVLLLSLVAVMLCFPPHRRRGVWVEARTGEPLPGGRANEYDRAYFGYIPSYMLIGTEAPQQHGMSSLGVGPGETYIIESSRHRVDWAFLAMQLVLATLLALPYLRAAGHAEDSGSLLANGRHNRGEQSNASKPPMVS